MLVAKINENMQATLANIVTPFLRDKLNLDVIDESKGSNNANEDVKPEIIWIKTITELKYGLQNPLH